MLVVRLVVILSSLIEFDWLEGGSTTISCFPTRVSFGGDMWLNLRYRRSKGVERGGGH